MFRLIWTLSVRTRDYLHRYMPSNRLLAAIRTRRGLKWGIPAMLVALPYILIASICSGSAADGGPGWLHLIVLWACWNALKFIIMGPVSVALLIRALLREAAVRRHQRHDSRVEASPAPKYYAGPIKLVARRPDAPKVAGAAKPAAAEPPPEAAAPANDGHGH